MTEGSRATWMRQEGLRQEGKHQAQYPTSYESSRTSGWVGWILFAGTMLIMLGIFQVMAGLVALLNDDFYLVSSSKLVLEMNYTAWGWTHLLIGALAIAAGAAVMLGQTWARVVCIGIAILSALAALGFLGAYPVWSLLLITFDVLVLYALCVHGRELQNAG